MKKFLLLIGILIIGVIAFKCSRSSVVKEPSTVRFTELDKEIQDTLFSLWQSSGGMRTTTKTVYYPRTKETWVHETTAPINFIDLTDNYVLEYKRTRLFNYLFDNRDKAVINKTNGWKHTFPWNEHEPIIIKGDKIYTPAVFLSFFVVSSKSEMDTCRFNVYTIKE